MPSKSDLINLEHSFLDRRVKLLPCQKENIPLLHSRGTSIHALSRMYGVNKRTIQFIIYPERQAKNVQLRKDRGGSMQYYNKEYNTKAKFEHRHYKKEVFKDIINQKP